MGAQRVHVFISRFPKVRAFRRDSRHGGLGAVAGELGTPKRPLLPRADSPASPPANFQTLMGEVLKTNALEIKCAHMYIQLYIHTHTYIYIHVSMDSGIRQALGLRDGCGRDLHPGALSPGLPLP